MDEMDSVSKTMNDRVKEVTPVNDDMSEIYHTVMVVYFVFSKAFMASPVLQRK